MCLPRVDRIRFTGVNYLPDRQTIFFRKRKIALVVPRHTHHRAIAVSHQHVIADPDFDLFIGEGMRDEQSCRHTLLFHRGQIGFHHGAVLRFVNERSDFRIARGGDQCQRMLRRDSAERDTHDGVGARGKDK